MARRACIFSTMVALLLLAACGGGGDNPAIEGTPPATAAPSAAGTTQPNPSSTAGPTATASPAASPPAVVAAFLPGLSAEVTGILDACLAGDDAACDRAQEPGRLSDGDFSRLNVACTGGREGACTLRDRLVQAELRLHCREGDQSACDAAKTQPGQ